MVKPSKIERFADEYLLDLNATKAAERAGYSPKTAKVQGSALLTKPDVQRMIQAKIAARKKRTYVSQDRVIRELAYLAFSDMSHFAKWDAEGVALCDSAGLKREQRRAIKEIYETKTEHGGSVKIKLHDKLKALELLGKHLGLFRDDGNRPDDEDDLPEAEHTAEYTERILREVLGLPKGERNIIDVSPPADEPVA